LDDGLGPVPERILCSGCSGVGERGGSCDRRWDADIEGRSRFGVVEPLEGNPSDTRLSPFAEGPVEEGCDPFIDLLSVDELSLRFRLMYFSIASASRSLTREANWDSAEEGLAGGFNWPGNVALAEAVWPMTSGGWYKELADGWEGDEEVDNDE